VLITRLNHFTIFLLKSHSQFALTGIVASRFSIYTCLPACMAIRVPGAYHWSGVALKMASTLLSLQTS
jgi:hypothetical protein